MELKAHGFSLVEIMLAVFIFGLMGVVVISALIYGREGTAGAVDRNRAAQLANEGLEAVRNIASTDFANLSSYNNSTDYYLSTLSNRWNLITTPSQVDGLFERTIVFADGPSGSRKVTVSVEWPGTTARDGRLQASTYIANWQASTAPPDKTGLFVYANGSTSSDRLTYRKITSSGNWTDPVDLPDIDAGTSNRVARSVKLYSGMSGSAKMVLSRHYNGSSQFMYGTYWNGSGFSAPQLLGQWNSNDWLNSGNYSGCFMANGSYVAVYNDGTNRPKYRTFDGTSWSAQSSLPQLGGSSNFPTNVVAKCRPGTNEAMAAFLGYNYDTDTSYFANGSWSSYTNHAQNATSNGRKLIDFDWSPVDSAIGILLYTNTPNDKSIRARTFTADGQGSGSWNPVANASPEANGPEIGSLRIVARQAGAAEFMACDKDTDTTPNIYCYKLLPGAGGFSTPANNTITNSTDPGGQLSFDIAYEPVGGVTGFVAYSDNTNSAKLKLYNSTTVSWSTNPIAAPNAEGSVQKTKVASKPDSNDAMIIVADGDKNLYSVMYNGTNNNLYTTPPGRAWTSHNANGPSNSAVWFDFGWDS